MLGLVLCCVLHRYIQNSFVPPHGKSICLRLNKYVLIVMEAQLHP